MKIYGIPQIERYTGRNDYAFKEVLGSEANNDILIEFITLVAGMDAPFEAAANAEL